MKRAISWNYDSLSFLLSFFGTFRGRWVGKIYHSETNEDPPCEWIHRKVWNNLFNNLIERVSKVFSIGVRPAFFDVGGGVVFSINFLSFVFFGFFKQTNLFGSKTQYMIICFIHGQDTKLSLSSVGYVGVPFMWPNSFL